MAHSAEHGVPLFVLVVRRAKGDAFSVTVTRTPQTEDEWSYVQSVLRRLAAVPPAEDER